MDSQSTEPSLANTYPKYCIVLLKKAMLMRFLKLENLCKLDPHQSAYDVNNVVTAVLMLSIEISLASSD